MHKKFIKALAWNSSVVFLYKAILLFHQIMLYSIISKTLYGIQSTLFACIYFVIAITNFGFEETLLPFFSTYSQSKRQFLQLINYLILRIIVVTTLTITMYKMILFYASTDFIENLKNYCDHQLLIIIMLIFFVESIKKSMNAIAQLAFLNKQIAYAELGMLFSYVSIIWISYGSGQAISLHTIFLSMLVTATIELMYLTLVLLQYYQHLPTTLTTTPKIASIIIARQSMYNYIHQLSKTIFSPNSMTILFAYLLGFQQAATIKFFTNIITLGYTFIYKIISNAGGATLSHVHQASTDLIRDVFSKITTVYFQFLLTMTVMVSIILGCSWYRATITNTMVLQITLFFIVSFLEQITLIYERLFISQSRADILAIVNSCELMMLLPILYCILFYAGDKNYNYIIFIFFVIIKLISLFAIAFLAFKYWGIKLMFPSKHNIK